jgi:branched-chain amino acid transport system substrate-binding protein
MHQSKKLKLSIGIIVVAIVAIAYFVFQVQNQPTSANTIKIGFIGPLTGDAAAYGEPARNIIQLAVENINKAKGINGKMLEIIYEDGKCNGKDAANAMQKLVNVDKVQVVIGGFCSSESLAAVPIATQSKVLLVSAGSSSPDLTAISKYFVRNYPSDATQGSVLAAVAYNKKNWRKVAFIQEQLDYPLGIYQAFTSHFEQLGGNVLKEEFPTNSTDFRSQLTKLRAEKPDAVFIDTQTPAAAERILRQMKDLNWKPNLLISDAVSGDLETVEKNADLLEGALAAEFGVDPKNEKFKAMVEDYKNKYKNEPPYQSYAQTEYDAVYMIRDAIAEVGYNSEKIADWFRTVKNWSGASGLITIGDDGDRDSGHVPKVIRNGKVELLN